MKNIHIENFELLKKDLSWYINFCKFKIINPKGKNIKFIKNWNYIYDYNSNSLNKSHHNDTYNSNILIDNEIYCRINYYNDWDNMDFKQCWLCVKIYSPPKKYYKNMSYQPPIMAEIVNFKIIKIDNKYYYSGSDID